ncbi:site-specific DNA-methyltransferase [Fusobacterium polymorphum]|uniref:DNA methyltransferase n=1 Tax=Fusobacterium nucleatum subsp. polymorphum TaxID=76857 RepID=UPI0030D62395
MSYKEKILSLLNENLKEEKITFDKLNIIVLDVSRVVDKKITSEINQLKKNISIKIDSNFKNKLRDYLLGYPIEIENNLNLKNINFTDEELSNAYNLVFEGFNRNVNRMVSSLVSRYKKKYKILNNSHYDDYLNYFKEIYENQYQFVAIQLKANYNLKIENIIDYIENIYNRISNYHNIAIIFEDSFKEIFSWELIAKVAISLENLRHESNFSLFNNNRKHRIEDLKEFLMKNKRINKEGINEIIEKFYHYIDYGFQFLDFFITENGDKKILIMQKVELDEKTIPCPSCFETKARGNSYPKVLYKSFECQNDNCPARSKIGRGKRYDLFSIKRQIMLERNALEDYIDDNIYSTYRKDIIKNNTDILSLISLYSWKDDNILLVNFEENIGKKYLGRNVSCIKENFQNKSVLKKEIEIIEFYKEMYRKIIPFKDFESIDLVELGEEIIINANSTDALYKKILKQKNIKIGAAITSPPYFNAREYSQWSNLICYFVDMMINAKSVFDNMENNGTYIYNIGDIVDQDNIYVKSNMSKRRQMLGFYSILIFKIVGYQCESNIIWDKGEVQSKRNSTPNHFPGYLKPINVYEHALVFKKTDKEIEYKKTQVVKIDPVIKINSKGENILGHTAPFPIELAELIIPYIYNRDYYILDPYLGSGSTLIAMIKNELKGIGFEINKDYFSLAYSRINDFIKN